jgi:hypothetical protein
MSLIELLELKSRLQNKKTAKVVENSAVQAQLEHASMSIHNLEKELKGAKATIK